MLVQSDIKPENVLFETAADDSPIKLIDFGLARKHTSARPMTSLLGTAYYTAPEVLRKRYTKACDLFSVGVIAYILMCGYPPFNGPTNEAVSDAILRGAYQFDANDWAGTSKECRDFVRRLLERDPLRRLTAEEALRHPWMAGRAPEGDAVEMEEDEAVHNQSAPESPSVEDVFEGFSRLVSCGTY